jgi:hypothetical protein
MNNKLEGFIKENKKDFEVNGPSSALWDRISAELDQQEAKPKKTFKLNQWMSVAAVLVLGFSIYFIANYNNAKQINVADINPEYGKKEVNFVNQIEIKKDSLANFATNNPDLYKKFTADLKNLDDEYEKLKAQLPNTPNQYSIIRAMVKNREMQLQILNQQLLIINQVNQYKTERSI